MFCEWPLSFSIIFKVHLCYSFYQYFTFLYDWIIFNCMGVSYFVYHSSVDGHLGFFHFLTIMNKVAMDICAQLFVWTYVFVSLEYIPKSVTSGSYMVTLCLTFWGTAKLFSKMATQFNIPLSTCEDFNFSIFLSTLITVHLFIKVVLVWSGISLWFWFAFPND